MSPSLQLRSKYGSSGPYNHRDVGDLELNYERLNLAFDTGLTIITYTADPGTHSAEALALLGTLAATAAAKASSAP
jgi:hypothetical protein